MPSEDIQIIGTDTPALPTYSAPRGASLDAYLASAERHRDQGQHVFDDGFAAIDRIAGVISRFAGGRPVETARAADGREFVPFTVRRLAHGKQIAPHHDYHYPLALYDEVFTVGAVDRSGAVTAFSSRGPVSVDDSGRVKPDIVAPGADILSAFPNGTYATHEGTSMAGPHVAGAVALMWSANPALIGDIDRTEQLLIETATPATDVVSCGDAERPNNSSGYGIINVYEAVRQSFE